MENTDVSLYDPCCLLFLCWLAGLVIHIWSEVWGPIIMSVYNLTHRERLAGSQGRLVISVPFPKSGYACMGFGLLTTELRKHGNMGNKFPEPMSVFRNQAIRPIRQGRNIQESVELLSNSSKIDGN